MHPHFAQSIAEQRRIEFISRADAYRQAAVARRADTHSYVRDPFDGIIVGTTALAVRPIEPSDGVRLKQLVARMSPASRRFRFFSSVNRLAPREVEHFVNVDHYCREALVALRDDDLIAVARYDGSCIGGDAEIALAVDDAWQHHGIGRQLVRRLAWIAARRNFDTLTASILPDNRAALALVHDIAPKASVRWGDGAFRVTIPLVSA